MPVRPEVWNGLQAKMAAAGLTSTATAAAAKGMSVLTKWIIGGTAAAVVGVTTTVLVMQSAEKDVQPKEVVQVPQENGTISQQPQSEEASTTLTASSNETSQTNQYNSPDQRNLPSGMQTFVFDNSELLKIVTPDPFLNLPDVKPTVIPANTEAPEVDFKALPEDKKLETTPEETVAALPEEQVAAKEAALVVPNVFTPDGNNINDEFFVTSANISEADIIIQNSENKIVYRSNDIHFRWNGRINGTEDPASPGTYACVIVYKDEAGKTHKKIQLLELER